MKAIEPSKGLHLLKRDFQKKFLDDQCEQLIAGLDEAITATFKAAPLRVKQRYILDHTTATRTPVGKEAQLERGLHKQWSDAECLPAVGCWERIVAFQVNLPGRRDDKGWGEIDLLGVSSEGLPMVIELKHGSSQEPPPALLVQATAYAIALQKAWGILRQEWMQKVGSRSALKTALLPARIVCAAPSSYWSEWQQQTRANAFIRLREELQERGIPSVLVTLDEHAGTHRAQPLAQLV